MRRFGGCCDFFARRPLAWLLNVFLGPRFMAASFAAIVAAAPASLIAVAARFALRLCGFIHAWTGRA